MFVINKVIFQTFVLDNVIRNVILIIKRTSRHGLGPGKQVQGVSKEGYLRIELNTNTHTHSRNSSIINICQLMTDICHHYNIYLVQTTAALNENCRFCRIF